MDAMNIVYASDNKFYKMLKCSIFSVLQMNRENFVFHILNNGISKKNKDDLKNIVNSYGCKVFFYDVCMDEISLFSKMRLTKDWPIIVMARLHIENILPNNLNRVLYIDCDTLIVDSLDNLFSEIYSQKSIYGVLDCMDENYRKKIGLSKGDVYINSGVILINLNKLRDNDSSKRVDKIIGSKIGLFKYPDQDVINVTFLNDIGIIPIRYNVISQIFPFTWKQYLFYRNSKNYYSRDEFEQAKIDPAIIHFTSGFAYARPWYKNSLHPYKELFYNCYQKANGKMDYSGYDNRSKIQRIMAVLFYKMPFPSIIILKIMRKVNNR